MEAPGHVPSVPSPKSGTAFKGTSLSRTDNNVELF